MATSLGHENSLPSPNAGPCTDARTYVNSTHGFVPLLYIRVRAQLICQGLFSSQTKKIWSV